MLEDGGLENAVREAKRERRKRVRDIRTVLENAVGEQLKGLIKKDFSENYHCLLKKKKSLFSKYALCFRILFEVSHSIYFYEP